MEITDIQTLKYIGFGGLSIFVIDKLFKLIYSLITVVKQKKNGGTELQYKEKSRARINETNRTIREIKQPIWDTKNTMEDIREVVTLKKDGVPLIYNKGLELSVNNLNTSIKQLASVIDK